MADTKSPLTPILDALDAAADPPAEGATDAVGLRERLAAADTTVDAAASGESDALPLDEAREQLRDARSALASLGYDVDGAAEGSGRASTFGPDMAAAVALFQEEHDLEVTRELDPLTYEALMAAYEQAVEAGRGPGEDLEDADDFDPMPGGGM